MALLLLITDKHFRHYQIRWLLIVEGSLISILIEITRDLPLFRRIPFCRFIAYLKSYVSESFQTRMIVLLNEFHLVVIASTLLQVARVVASKFTMYKREDRLTRWNAVNHSRCWVGILKRWCWLTLTKKIKKDQWGVKKIPMFICFINDWLI